MTWIEIRHGTNTFNSRIIHVRFGHKNESTLACRHTVGRVYTGCFLSVIRISHKAYQMMEREVDNEIPNSRKQKRFTIKSDFIEVINLSVERKVTVLTIALHSHLPVTMTVSSWTKSCRPTKQFPISRGHSRRRRWSITYMEFDKTGTRKHIPTIAVTAFTAKRPNLA